VAGRSRPREAPQRPATSPGILPEVTNSDFQGDQEPPLGTASTVGWHFVSAAQIEIFCCVGGSARLI
jgi:hypothetical protein